MFDIIRINICLIFFVQWINIIRVYNILTTMNLSYKLFLILESLKKALSAEQFSTRIVKYILIVNYKLRKYNNNITFFTLNIFQIYSVLNILTSNGSLYTPNII